MSINEHSATPSRELPTISHYIAGRDVVDEPVRSSSVFNPATGTVSARVLLASPSTVLLAVAAAQDAFPEWSETPPLKRARILFRFKQLLAAIN